MKENIDNHDDIRDLIRKEGLLRPSAGFTSNIIGYLEENKKISIAYKPLLSKSAWRIIIAVLTGIILLCWQLTSRNTSESLFTKDFFNKIRNLVDGIDLSFSFNYNALLIITLAMLSMGILLIIDFWYDSKQGRKVTG